MVVDYIYNVHELGDADCGKAMEMGTFLERDFFALLVGVDPSVLASTVIEGSGGRRIFYPGHDTAWCSR